MRSPSLSHLALLAAGATAITGLSASLVLPAAATSLTRLSEGHVDAIDIAVEGGAFELSVHDESVEPDVERDPASVRLIVKREAETAVPDDSGYAFLGPAGSPVWVLPEIEDENLLWLGLATEEIEPGVLSGDQLKIRFTKVIGPDGLSLFDLAQDGSPNILVDSEDGLPDVVTLPVGTHAHQNWAFEAVGTYKLTYRVVGTLAASGTRIISEATTVTFVVKS